MALMHEVAGKIETVEKMMLTVFVRNDRAVQFYYRLGFQLDEFSPPPRTLRDGRVVEGSYVILSKAVGS
jgi:ribosomal protein S18 acetylase RimI-like enzyme